MQCAGKMKTDTEQLHSEDEQVKDQRIDPEKVD